MAVAPVNVFNIFAQAAASYPDNVALHVGKKSHTYRELKNLAGRVRQSLLGVDSDQIAVLAYRSLSAYAGILGILQAGKTYVPLNPKFPAARNGTMLQMAGAKAIILDQRCFAMFEQLSELIEPGTTLILPEALATELPEAITASFSVIDLRTVEPIEQIVNVSEIANAYLLFTSGSTGTPKGVAVTHGNLSAYVDYSQSRYGIRPDDRLSQVFDLTFDLSVHDMFLTYRGAAGLYVLPEESMMAPAKFIKDHQLTVWFSVPSVAQFMGKLRMLKEMAFPSLRLSLFCGEPLTAMLAAQWVQAAANSIVENIYGPTEATIAISNYRLSHGEEISHINGVVSIGKVFETQRYCLIDPHGNQTYGEGELCLSGSQITHGYWQDLKKTDEKFGSIPGQDGIWYRTGDLVREIDGSIFYISRSDHQIKIRGYRVELNEINNVINEYIGGGGICSVPVPFGATVTDGIVSFVESRFEPMSASLKEHLKRRLPEYMLPRRIVFIDEFPLNSNGKIDMMALARSIGQLP